MDCEMGGKLSWQRGLRRLRSAAWHLVGWLVVTSNMPQGLTLDQIVLKGFVTILDFGTGCKFVDKNKLEVGMWLIQWRQSCPSEKPQWGRKLGWQEPRYVQQRQMQSPIPGRETQPCVVAQAGCRLPRKELCSKRSWLTSWTWVSKGPLGCWKLTTAWAAAGGMWAAVRGNWLSLSVLALVRLHLQNHVQFGPPPYKTQHGILKWLQWSATKMKS